MEFSKGVIWSHRLVCQGTCILFASLNSLLRGEEVVGDVARSSVFLANVCFVDKGMASSVL